MSCYATTDLSDTENCDLATDYYSWEASELLGEQTRVAAVIHSNVSTGVDLEYWFDREKIIDHLLNYA